MKMHNVKRKHPNCFLSKHETFWQHMQLDVAEHLHTLGYNAKDGRHCCTGNSQALSIRM